MLTRRGNRELNITGTSTASGNLNGVQRISDIFVGVCDTYSNEEEMKQHCTSIGVELKKVDHLNTESEWYKAYKISIKSGDSEKCIKSDL